MALGDYVEIGRMDELGRLDTPVHRLDARSKAIATVAFIVVVMSYHRYEISALLPLSLYPLVLITIGGLPPGYLFKKVIIAAPFALLVGVFNPLLDRQTQASIWGYSISGGWLSFGSIMIRFVLTVTAALALVGCTGIHRLCAGLERLGLPRVLAVQLLLLYRYIFVIAEDGLRMLRSVHMRSTGTRSPGLRTYASLIGHLLLRSLGRAHRIYQAMIARGFDGEIRVLRPGRWGWSEVVFTTGWLAFFAVARAWNLAEALGRLLTRT
ncbi:MAG: cobalt ECF transporter T component CbiQ [Acidobacteriota bacterium]